eukprot:scaffold56534_cov16-Tisochrysis_lutea.AAC.1
MPAHYDDRAFPLSSLPLLACLSSGSSRAAADSLAWRAAANQRSLPTPCKRQRDATHHPPAVP